MNFRYFLRFFPISTCRKKDFIKAMSQNGAISVLARPYCLIKKNDSEVHPLFIESGSFFSSESFSGRPIDFSEIYSTRLVEITEIKMRTRTRVKLSLDECLTDRTLLTAINRLDNILDALPYLRTEVEVDGEVLSREQYLEKYHELRVYEGIEPFDILGK